MITENGVVCGRADWLYLQSGSNNLMDYYRGIKQLSEENISLWEKTLQFRHEWHQSRNIKYLQVFAPNKICVYPEFYPEELTIVGDRPIVQLIKKFGHLFTYQLDYLVARKKDFVLYYQNDTHWNHIGAFFAYQQIMELLEPPYNEQVLQIADLIFSEREFVGDLGKKLNPPRSYLAQMARVRSNHAQKTFDNEVQNRGQVKKFRNDSGVRGKIIIVGDSFSHCTIHFFKESFEEVIFCHAAFVDFEYIEKEKPDIVLAHAIERFIIKVPDDMNAPKIENYGNFLGKN